VTPILDARGLCKKFGAVTAAGGISISVEPDTVVGLIGTNGAGKTTFVNMVTGYLKPDAGVISFKGRDVTKLQPRQITQLGICRSFQIPQLYDSLTGLENVVVALGIVLRNSKRSRLGRAPKIVPGHGAPLMQAAENMLERFGLTSYRSSPARVLPEGVRKLLDIAMALAVKPEMLILDEPTSGVSSDEKFGIMETVMNAVRSEGVTVLFVEHDMEIVSRYSKRVIAFYEGRVLADGGPAHVLGDPDVRRYVVGGQIAMPPESKDIARA
jgi:branched-chain amino acid transport system ATP-binding protein